MEDQEAPEPPAVGEPEATSEPGDVEKAELDAEAEEDWVAGSIEVVFHSADRSGLKEWDFSDSTEQKSFPDVWSPELKQLLERNEFISWGPIFPLSYPWSTDSPEESRKFYENSGRYRYVSLHFPAQSDLVSIANELEELPEIVRAAPVPRLRPPFDPLCEPMVGKDDQVPADDDTQWYLFRCGINQAWTKASGQGVVIADIDWGFNPNHEDLVSRIKNSLNTFENSRSISSGDKFRHGTAVLGLAAGSVNGVGIAGVAYNATLWAIQAGSNVVEDEKHWLSAIDFVRREKSQERKVMILEIQTLKGGNVEMSVAISKAIVDAIGENVLVCVPAGNSGGDAGLGEDQKPIPPTGSVLVGATSYHPTLNRPGASNVGCRIVVYAPGDEDHDLTCGVPAKDDYTSRFGGTSGAVAKVAGVVALMLSMNDKLTQAEVCEILKQSPTPVTDQLNKPVGVLLNAKHAVCEALKRKTAII